MNLKRFPSTHCVAIPGNLRLWSAIILIVAALAVLVWLSGAAPADGSSVPAVAPGWTELTPPPPLASASGDDPDTAFPEDRAGFSAYYRVDSLDDSKPRLNVETVSGALLDKPDESNAARSGPGRQLELGANFGIVELPMFAAVGYGNLLEPRNITVYYDDRGWVVAYLPAGEPAAAIWRHDPAAGSGKAADHLEHNLLVLAINEVLIAGRADSPGLPTVSHDDVGYYDWQNADCNAFLLFSNDASSGESSPVNFVIPPKIIDVQASAAVLITSRYSNDGDAVTASLSLGNETVVAADATTLLGVAGFTITRPTDDNGHPQTSLHKMSVTVSGNDTSTGAVLLLYDKPQS